MMEPALKEYLKTILVIKKLVPETTTSTLIKQIESAIDNNLIVSCAKTPDIAMLVGPEAMALLGEHMVSTGRLTEAYLEYYAEAFKALDKVLKHMLRKQDMKAIQLRCFGSNKVKRDRANSNLR